MSGGIRTHLQAVPLISLGPATCPPHILLSPACGNTTEVRLASRPLRTAHTQKAASLNYRAGWNCLSYGGPAWVGGHTLVLLQPTLMRSETPGGLSMGKAKSPKSQHLPRDANVVHELYTDFSQRQSQNKSIKDFLIQMSIRFLNVLCFPVIFQKASPSSKTVFFSSSSYQSNLPADLPISKAGR